MVSDEMIKNMGGRLARMEQSIKDVQVENANLLQRLVTLESDAKIQDTLISELRKALFGKEKIYNQVLISKPDEAKSEGCTILASGNSHHFNICIENAIHFTKGKFETTFKVLRTTLVPPSHALCFYYTSLHDAQSILNQGYIPSISQCHGIPISMKGPDESLSDMTDINESLRQVVFALSIPRRILWAFPNAGTNASMDARFTSPYRVIPSNLLKSFVGSYHMPIAHCMKRIYQLIDVDERVASNSIDVGRTPENVVDLQLSNHQPTVQTSKDIHEYHPIVSSVRSNMKAGTLLLYHYTNPKFVELILKGGLRMSTQGQGDGGVYFSLKGPTSYGYGTDIHPELGDFETRLITDCYGKERLQEYYGKDVLSMVLICVVEEGLLSQAPGGRDNALMVSKEVFETLSSPHSDHHFYLPPDCIKAAVKLESISNSSPKVNVLKERKIIEMEIHNDMETSERAKLIMQKLRILSGNNVLAVLPVATPEIPSAYMSRTSVIDSIKHVLLVDREEQNNSHASREVKSKLKTCVLQGMGGMGKSTMATSFLHDIEVRSAFDNIVWLSFGQTPDIHALQESAHLQLTGHPMPHSINSLPPSIIPQQRREALKQASAGHNTLLVLDDIWDAEHTKFFAFLDHQTTSSLFVTTRVRKILKNAVEVDLSRLNDSNAMLLLLTKLGLEPSSMKAGSELHKLVLEVVDLTGGIPLTISIAAGLIESSGGEITRELVDAMKVDHLRTAKDDEGVGSMVSSLEDRLINTSLEMFKGPNRHLINTCFMAFSAFPEDIAIPGQVFDLISEHLIEASLQPNKNIMHTTSVSAASSEMSITSNSGSSLDGSSTHMLQVRRALTALVKANLCSGAYSDSIGFTVHDLIRDSAFSRSSTQFLLRLHTKVINQLIFKACDDENHMTIDNIQERSNFENSSGNELLMRYIETSLVWHMQNVLKRSPDDFEIPKSWYNHTNKVVFSNLALALGVNGIEKYATQCIEKRNDRVGAAKIYFSVDSLKGKQSAVESSSQQDGLVLRYITNALTILMSVNEIQYSGFELKVLFRVLIIERNQDKLLGYQNRIKELVDLLKMNSGGKDKENTQSLNVYDRNLQFIISFAEALVMSARITDRIRLLKSNRMENLSAILADLRQALEVSKTATKNAPNKTFKHYFASIYTAILFGYYIPVVSYSSEFIELTRQKHQLLRDAVEYYDFERCGKIYKESGKEIDSFLQGILTLTIAFCYNDMDLLERYRKKAVSAYKLHISRAVDTYRFVWVEVMITMNSTLPTLLEFSSKDKVLELVHALGFTSLNLFEKQFEHFWNDSNRSVGGGALVKAYVKSHLYFIMILSCPDSELFVDISSESSLIEGQAESTVASSPIQSNETGAKHKTEKSGYLKTILKMFPTAEEIISIEDNNTFFRSSIGSVVLYGAMCFHRFGAFESSLKCLKFGSESSRLTPLAQVGCYRLLGKIYHKKGDRTKSNYYFDTALSESNKMSFREVIGGIIERERENL